MLDIERKAVEGKNSDYVLQILNIELIGMFR